MSDYFDRSGNPQSFQEWAKGLGRDMTKKRVAETTLPNGRWVSTVWLGLNHAFGDGPPLIFETMVFTSREELQEEDCDRYSTEDEAVAGHARMVEKWATEA